MDAAVLGDRLPEGTQKPLLGPGSPPLQRRHGASSTVLAGLAFFEMLSQYPRSAFQGLCRDHQRGLAAVCDPNPPCPFARYRKPFQTTFLWRWWWLLHCDGVQFLLLGFLALDDEF